MFFLGIEIKTCKDVSLKQFWAIIALRFSNQMFSFNFVYNASVCLQTKWLSIMNHITNRHSWALGQCEHGPIEEEREDKPWLNPSSKLVKDLEKQVMEKRLLRTFPYYVTCQYVYNTFGYNYMLLKNE